MSSPSAGPPQNPIIFSRAYSNKIIRAYDEEHNSSKGALGLLSFLGRAFSFLRGKKKPSWQEKAHDRIAQHVRDFAKNDLRQFRSEHRYSRTLPPKLSTTAKLNLIQQSLLPYLRIDAEGNQELKTLTEQAIATVQKEFISEEEALAIEKQECRKETFAQLNLLESVYAFTRTPATASLEREKDRKTLVEEFQNELGVKEFRADLPQLVLGRLQTELHSLLPKDLPFTIDEAMLQKALKEKTPERQAKVLFQEAIKGMVDQTSTPQDKVKLLERCLEHIKENPNASKLREVLQEEKASVIAYTGRDISRASERIHLGDKSLSQTFLEKATREEKLALVEEAVSKSSLVFSEEDKKAVLQQLERGSLHPFTEEGSDSRSLLLHAVKERVFEGCQASFLEELGGSSSSKQVLIAKCFSQNIWMGGSSIRQFLRVDRTATPSLDRIAEKRDARKIQVSQNEDGSFEVRVEFTLMVRPKRGTLVDGQIQAVAEKPLTLCYKVSPDETPPLSNLHYEHGELRRSDDGTVRSDAEEERLSKDLRQFTESLENSTTAKVASVEESLNKQIVG